MSDGGYPAGFAPGVAERARRVALVALDVDGVLTDGGLYLDDAGVQMKRFHVRDGMGIRLLLEAGVAVGVITARRSQLLALRGAELKMSFIHQGIKDKWGCLAVELAERGLTPEQCAFMGDDLVDLPVLSRVGLATAPADAHPEVLSRVHWRAALGGGRGAVRCLADNLLLAHGAWEAAVARFLGTA